MEGLRIGVTAARKGRELADALERRGARAVLGPTLRTVPPPSDATLLDETDAILGAAPCWAVASTGVGMLAWVDAAAAHGRGDALVDLLRATPTAARGPKAVAGLRVAIGAEPRFVAPQETDAAVAAWLRPRVRPGDTVAVQVHGADDGSAYAELEAAGATVLRACAYRSALPVDLEPARALVRRVLAGDLDVVVATSRPAVRNLVRIAADVCDRDALVAALRDRVAVAAVGPVTAAAFEEVGVGVDVMPQRFRTADLIRAIDGWAARRAPGAPGTGPRAAGAPTGCPDAALELVPDTRVVRIGPRAVPLGPREFAALAALVRRPGIVCRPDVLAREAWGHDAPDDPTQVKHLISRLRRKLGPAGAALQTVRGVGYRYDVERVA